MPPTKAQKMIVAGRQSGKSRMVAQEFLESYVGSVDKNNYNYCIRLIKKAIRGGSVTRLFEKALIPLTIDADIIKNQDRLNDYERLRICKALANIIEGGFHKDNVVGCAVIVLDRNWRLLPADVIEGNGKRFKALLVIENL